ncbi:MAG: HEAT repeat domain-containing protein [Deltaproteobacteria bacterium]|nr:HEAT repeat domain-containing protein [Deltaproteobacteria bacterium]
MRLLGAAALIVVGSSIASAAPVATLSTDVDGDGTPDAIELGADGVLRIGGKPAATVKVADAVVRGVIDVGGTGTRQLIVVEMILPQREEAVILARERGTWIEVQRFPLGGVGLDKDFGFDVDATEAGVYRFQVRSDLRRCDDKPLYLFPQGFDPRTKSFQPVVPPFAFDPGVTTLPAKLDTLPAAPPVLYKARTASTQAGAGDAGALSIPSELDDGRVETVWSEGVGSDGHGNLFSFEPRLAGVQARQLRIIPGRHANPRIPKDTNRAHELAIVTAQKTWRVVLPDAGKEPLGTAYTVDLPAAVTGCVSVVLVSTYGPPTGTTAIAELEVFAEGERLSGGDAMLAKIVADGKDGETSAAAALARRGASAAVAIDAEIAKTTDALARRRLIAVLVKIQDPAAKAALARAATENWATGPALLDLVDALANNGLVQELHGVAGNSAVELAARVAAVRRLGPANKSLPLLVDLAGTGPHELRRAVIDRLSLAAADALIDAATRSTEPAAAGDLWRALTRRARTDASAHAQVLVAMLAALPGATDYERRYRLVDGIATLGDLAALRGLEALLRGMPPGAQTSALRQVAVRAIGYAPRAEAVKLVLAFSQDPDPGVRIAVLSALAGAEAEPGDPWHTADGPDGIDRVIINALATDSWPEIRRRAASTLGARCQRIGPAKALGDAVAKDKHIDVRVDSLTALVQCRASGIDQLLAKTWDDSKAPIELRAQAVSLAVVLGDPKLGAMLVGKFTRWRGAAIESAEALALAQSAAASIARLNAPGAAQALIGALDDSAFPEIVSAAALALGALGPACPPAAKAKLNAIARSDEQSAVAAKRAAAQCGR